MLEEVLFICRPNKVWHKRCTVLIHGSMCRTKSEETFETHFAILHLDTYVTLYWDNNSLISHTRCRQPAGCFWVSGSLEWSNAIFAGRELRVRVCRSGWVGGHTRSRAKVGAKCRTGVQTGKDGRVEWNRKDCGKAQCVNTGCSSGPGQAGYDPSGTSDESGEIITNNTPTGTNEHTQDIFSPWTLAYTTDLWFVLWNMLLSCFMTSNHRKVMFLLCFVFFCFFVLYPWQFFLFFSLWLILKKKKIETKKHKKDNK